MSILLATPNNQGSTPVGHAAKSHILNLISRFTATCKLECFKFPICNTTWTYEAHHHTSLLGTIWKFTSEHDVWRHSTTGRACKALHWQKPHWPPLWAEPSGALHRLHLFWLVSVRHVMRHPSSNERDNNRHAYEDEDVQQMNFSSVSVLPILCLGQLSLRMSQCTIRFGCNPTRCFCIRRYVRGPVSEMSRSFNMQQGCMRRRLAAV